MITAVILAAGESSRLGRPKQLIEYRGGTLLARAIETALESKCDNVMIVIGAHGDIVRREAQRFKVKVVENAEWPEGKASSIRAAINAVSKQSETASGILFLACDQPGVTIDLLNELIDRFRSSLEASVACAYADTIGIPAIIPRRLFPQLKILRGDNGAQSVLQAVRDQVVTVEFAQGHIDIDTEEDVKQLIDRGHQSEIGY